MVPFYHPDEVSDEAPLVLKWLEGRGPPDAPERRELGDMVG